MDRPRIVLSNYAYPLRGWLAVDTSALPIRLATISHLDEWTTMASRKYGGDAYDLPEPPAPKESRVEWVYNDLERDAFDARIEQWEADTFAGRNGWVVS